jgi:hypothetical protein
VDRDPAEVAVPELDLAGMHGTVASATFTVTG